MGRVTVEDINKAAGDLAKAFNEFGITVEGLADVLQDYNALAKEYRTLVERFRMPEKPVYKGDGIWVCPMCDARIQPKHSHCHKCGKHLGWNKRKKK